MQKTHFFKFAPERWSTVLFPKKCWKRLFQPAIVQHPNAGRNIQQLVDWAIIKYPEFKPCRGSKKRWGLWGILQISSNVPNSLMLSYNETNCTNVNTTEIAPFYYAKPNNNQLLSYHKCVQLLQVKHTIVFQLLYLSPYKLHNNGYNNWQYKTHLHKYNEHLRNHLRL